MPPACPRCTVALSLIDLPPKGPIRALVTVLGRFEGYGGRNNCIETKEKYNLPIAEVGFGLAGPDHPQLSILRSIKI